MLARPIAAAPFFGLSGGLPTAIAAWFLRSRRAHVAGARTPDQRFHPDLLSTPEVWLRGSLPDVPALLQPVAHSLLQSLEEVRAVVPGLDRAALAVHPQGAASVGYHLRHAAGSIDRLFTYARGETLSHDQLATLSRERDDAGADADDLVSSFEATVERALEQLRTIDPATLLDLREVGRARLPSTVLGLLFHAAEHTQRHVGQLTTTARIVRGRSISAEPTRDLTS